MATPCTSNLTSGFIDLATFDELEKYMYGGPDATAYFVRETRKSTWFTQVPVILSRASGTPQFDQEWSVTISRAGDYLLQTWLRLCTPEICPVTTAQGKQAGPTGSFGLRWTKNFMHNLIRDCCITFNDLVAARFDNYHLDFWTSFTVPASKWNGYSNMIGNIDSLVTVQGNALQGEGPGAEEYQWNGPDSTPKGDAYFANRKWMEYGCIPQATLNLPLPFFFSRDSGVALPTAALPYNDMRINFAFRPWECLLVKQYLLVSQMEAAKVGKNKYQTALNTGNYKGIYVGNASQDDIQGSAPTLTNVQVWGNYAIVSNDERKRMACAPRDILIEQVQTAPKQTYNPNTNGVPSYDIRFSHAIKVLFFAVRNATMPAEYSNYTTTSPTLVGYTGRVTTQGSGYFDPIYATSLIYENTNRLAQMGSDYYSLINPYYTALRIPDATGYHMYSYSLDFLCLDPMGSTNYGKLTNVSIVPEASTCAVEANAATTNNGKGGVVDDSDGQTPSHCWVRYGNDFRQNYEFVVTVVNNNIIRISGGALGFPVL